MDCSNLDRYIDGEIIQFADDTKLSGGVDTSEEWNTIQMDQDKLRNQSMEIS